MDRYNFEEYISAYIDGDLSIDEKKEFESIMNSEPECKTKFEKVELLIKNLNQAPQVKTSADFMEKLQAKIDAHNQPKETILDKISNFLLGPKIRPVYGLGMSVAVFLIVFTSLNQDNSSLTDASNKNSIAVEKYPTEAIAYEENEEDSADIDDMDPNISIRMASGKVSD
tara:strand:+ start:1262 stop:1771 length:510 start_codon:yes stop_codon:yes gene_type:complete